MVNRFCLLLSVAFMLCSSATQAQDMEAGLLLGASNYSGDLSKQRINLGETQPSIGILYRYYFSPKINIEGSLTYARVSGDDKNYDDDDFRRKRNLRFKSNIFEASVQGEYNILPFISNTQSYNWSPYVFGGVGLFYFNPKTEFENETVSLADLNTEGEDYSQIQLAIPFGLGVKYSIGNRWNIGVELGFRKLFTDYLDDVSQQYVQLDDEKAKELQDRSDELDEFDNPQFSNGRFRGNPDNDDWYSIAGFTITKTFRNNQCTGDFY